jgi:hypothetical protein
MEKVAQSTTTNREQAYFAQIAIDQVRPCNREFEAWLPNPSGFKSHYLNLVVMTPTSLANLASKSQHCFYCDLRKVRTAHISD